MYPVPGTIYIFKKFSLYQIRSSQVTIASVRTDYYHMNSFNAQCSFDDKVLMFKNSEAKPLFSTFKLLSKSLT